MIPLSVPNFEGKEREYVNDAVEQGWVSTAGKYVNILEENLKQYLKAPAVAACQSGTAALHLSIIDAGVQAGDYVLVSPLTFIAAVNPIKYEKANPVFIDCDDSLCIDPYKIKKFCEEECVFENAILKYKKDGHRVAAIVVVHIFGNMANMEMIMDIAQKYKLKVIEDATEALGSHYSEGRFSGMYAGTIGDYGAYSFNGNKIITTGGGGAVTAKNSEQVHHMKYLSTQAKDDAQFYVHNEIGYNYRMTNLQAALGVAQLEKLPEYIQRKQNNYQRYKELFDGFELCSLLEFEKGIFSNKWFYSLQINRKYIQTDLEKILAMLMERGVQTRTIWGLICEQKPYRNDITYEIEKAFRYSKCILNIPCSTNITEDEIKKVAETIKNVLEQLVK